MIVWGRKEDIQVGVAHVADKWLLKFAAKYPQHTRKFGPSKNATMLYRSAAVLESVEAGETFETEN